MVNYDYINKISHGYVELMKKAEEEYKSIKLENNESDMEYCNQELLKNTKQTQSIIIMIN